MDVEVPDIHLHRHVPEFAILISSSRHAPEHCDSEQILLHMLDSLLRSDILAIPGHGRAVSGLGTEQGLPVHHVHIHMV